MSSTAEHAAWITTRRDAAADFGERPKREENRKNTYHHFSSWQENTIQEYLRISCIICSIKYMFFFPVWPHFWKSSVDRNGSRWQSAKLKVTDRGSQWTGGWDQYAICSGATTSLSTNIFGFISMLWNESARQMNLNATRPLRRSMSHWKTDLKNVTFFISLVQNTFN